MKNILLILLFTISGYSQSSFNTYIFESTKIGEGSQLQEEINKVRIEVKYDRINIYSNSVPRVYCLYKPNNPILELDNGAKVRQIEANEFRISPTGQKLGNGTFKLEIITSTGSIFYEVVEIPKEADKN